MGMAHIHSRAMQGLHTPRVDVEVDLANGLPSFSLVGLADTEVKEARERVRAAIVNSGLVFPNNQRITVNLAPADLRKDSGRFDLAIALGILAASGQIQRQDWAGWTFAAELSLSGQLRPVGGALATALSMANEGDERILVLAHENAAEAARVPHVRVAGAAHLLDVMDYLGAAESARNGLGVEPQGTSSSQHNPGGWSWPSPPPFQCRAQTVDLSEVRGQESAKRALTIAAAGGHSVLLVGPPGSGKSMLAHRFVTLLPPLSPTQALQSAAIHSLMGSFEADQWGQRPMVSPHHSASAAALIGGGSPPRPGAITQAHHGVLFLDELPEFNRTALEALREPLETGTIHISRASNHAEFPAQFQLIAAMNPCPCGYWGHAQGSCHCTPDQVRRYQSRISGPLLDRIDLQIEVTAIDTAALIQMPEPPANIQSEHGIPVAEVSTEPSGATRAQAALNFALLRQGCVNQQLHGNALLQQAQLSATTMQFVERAAEKMQWSSRRVHRIIRIARTIADLEEAHAVERHHITEAMQYQRALLKTNA